MSRRCGKYKNKEVCNVIWWVWPRKDSSVNEACCSRQQQLTAWPCLCRRKTAFWAYVCEWRSAQVPRHSSECTENDVNQFDHCEHTLSVALSTVHCISWNAKWLRLMMKMAPEMEAVRVSKRTNKWCHCSKCPQSLLDSFFTSTKLDNQLGHSSSDDHFSREKKTSFVKTQFLALTFWIKSIAVQANQ